jgi:hypothetical protein
VILTSIAGIGSVIGAVVVFGNGSVSVGALAGGTHAGRHHGGGPDNHRADHTPSVVTTSTAPVTRCPLTGTPVPGGGPVPARPALAVKVDNYITARPQSGLNDADIVYEEQVEGVITRYVAIFQCQQAPLVGPVRSARNVDVGILGQFGQPLLAHVGGIDPVIADIDSSPITNLDLTSTVEQHPPGRVAPYDTYSSTAQLWGLRPTHTTPPAPVFTYSASPPNDADALPVGLVRVDFSGNSDIIWRWDPETGQFLRNYLYYKDNLATGTQNSATNVIVQFVHITYGPWVENATGGLEVQEDLYDDASGSALVFRNGLEIPGTWSRDALTQPTRFVTDSGQPITLAPGRTWVELLTATSPVDTTPPLSTMVTTTTTPSAHLGQNASETHGDKGTRSATLPPSPRTSIAIHNTT